MNEVEASYAMRERAMEREKRHKLILIGESN
jgi:hypothetical protein